MPKGFGDSYLSDGPSYSDPRARGRGRTRVRSSSFDPPGYKHQGFTRGFSLGEETGWREGYNLGLQRGAQIASELGFYQGYVHAWITVLEREETVKQRKLSALRTLLDMTKSFPRASLYDEDIMDKLLKIRAQFKQVVALLNVGADGSTIPDINEQQQQQQQQQHQQSEMSF